MLLCGTQWNGTEHRARAGSDGTRSKGRAGAWSSGRRDMERSAVRVAAGIDITDQTDESIIIIFFLFYGVISVQDLKNRIRELGSRLPVHLSDCC